MASPTKVHVNALLEQLKESWRLGSGSAFGACFTDDAHFVAFDGTVLRGPHAISAYHQAAFDRYLQHTILVLAVCEIKALGDDVLLVFTNGNIRSTAEGAVPLTGESIGTMALTLQEGKARIHAFQNTRQRPITNEASAAAWKEFDAVWNGFS